MACQRERPANKGIDPTSIVLGYHVNQRARVMPNTLDAV